MAVGKEIRNQIKSIKNTQKITSAMEMVAASKMRKTQERMRASKPYASKIYDVVKHIARATSEYRHPFMTVREIKRVGLIVVTSDRGLCGGLNANLLRETIGTMRKWQADGWSVVAGLKPADVGTDEARRLGCTHYLERGEAVQVRK